MTFASEGHSRGLLRVSKTFAKDHLQLYSSPGQDEEVVDLKLLDPGDLHLELLHVGLHLVDDVAHRHVQQQVLVVVVKHCQETRVTSFLYY